ncbi:MAG: alpha-2-macroglobulin family protein [Methylobacteriaceae bacterium]|nr:alpha-2-macroglobulin family protein [Methylobacteriaceae bacterium]
MHMLARAISLFLLCAATLTPAHAQQKAYTNEQLASDAVRLEAQVRRDADTRARKPLDQIRRDMVAAAARNDTPAALRALAQIVAPDTKNAASWVSYARTALAVPANSASVYELKNEAAAAAYIAYQRASTKPDEAAALSLLADIYASRQEWRPALNAYRASLVSNDVPAVRSTYQRLREEHGFRILDYKVDNESASPRACFQFSEPLARGRVDFAPYVAVSGTANAAVSTEDQQLCVEGLKHGQHYSVILRQGLPSAVDEALLKPADYDIYVRDRSPQVRFTGRNYVLPRVGQEGIPVISINTRKIAVDILRIGDRNLLSAVHSDDFLAQLGTYRLKQYVNEKATKIWSGTMDTASELNKDETTAFPVLEAVGKLEPGVYVMVARAGEQKPLVPGNDSEDYDDDQKATQWFTVSDLGLTTFAGADGIHVLVRSLASAQPLAGIELRLVAKNNEILATSRTPSDGHVRFDPGLARGTAGLAPGLIVATNAGGDYGFLDLQQTPFDLSDRGVKGREAPRALDAFVFAERGVYRSGESVNVTAQLRDAKSVAVSGLPLTLVFKRPDGVEYKRVSVADQGLGGRAYSLALLSGAASGTWRIEAYADPKSPKIGETSFLVEDYVPERLDMTLKAAANVARLSQPVDVAADVRYLYGAPGANLEISGDVSVKAADENGLPALKGYEAGLSDEAFETVRSQLEDKVTTDAKGAAKVSVPVPDATATRPLEAEIVLRAGEPGGRAIERTLHLPILPKGGVIGVKKNFDDELSDGSVATFDVIAVGPDGRRTTRRNVSWSLYRINNDYQWYRADGRWNFERVKSSRRLAEGKIDIAGNDPAKISVPVGLGAHRLDVRSDDGGDMPTSITFDVGWSGGSTAQTPDLLELTLDKESYAAGEPMAMKISSGFDGKATIAIVGDGVQAVTTSDLKKGDNEIRMPVSADWGAGAYAVALAHRPLDIAAKRMPGRSLGVAWFGIDESAHKLDVKLNAPEKIRPRGKLDIPVELAGLSPGEDAYVTVAAVDIGILNLTQYETPDPNDYFFGQRQLGSEIRDIYGYLIDGMQGVRGMIRSGGDAGADLSAEKPTQEPLARYSGVVKVGADGKANISFDIPAFNGSVRVMASAWSKTRVGHAQQDVIIRDPVVVQATLPRFLSLGDQSRFHVQIDNVEGKSGRYAVDLALEGPVSASADALKKSLALSVGARSSLAIPVNATGIGRVDLDLHLTGPDVDLKQSLALNVDAGTGEFARRSVQSLAPGASLTISRDLLADFVPGTGTVSVGVSPAGAIDVPALLQALDRYPYGCSEQIVSRALPLLYVNKLASAERLAIDAGVQDRIRDSIDKVLSRQDSTGAFGLWSANAGDDRWLNAFITDFLTRAREEGYAVPQRAFDQALERLRNGVANSADAKDADTSALAYAIYVLARNGRPVMGDLRYLVDTKLNDFTSPLARAQLAAALAMLGDKGRAERVFDSAAKRLDEQRNSRFSRPDYGSRLRDGAGLLALAAESNSARNDIQLAALAVESERAASTYTSTQENAWMVLAAEALMKDAQSISLSIDGEPQSGAFYRGWKGASLDQRDVVITNNGQAAVRVALTSVGHPTAQEPATSRGYEVERTYYKLDGKQADPATIKQNDRFVAVLKVTESEAAYARLLLVDHLPAGLEIDNPDLFDGGSTDNLSWLKRNVEPTHTEARDDRYVATFDRDGKDKATFTIAYIVRAVTPGRYILPPASIEDMYRPDRFGRTGFGTLVVQEAK